MLTTALSALLALAWVSTARAVDQTVPGAGNADAARLAASSALVQSARRFIAGRIDQIRDPKLGHNVKDLVENRFLCVKHRAGDGRAGSSSWQSRSVATA